ncbi:hypothetical protein QYF50_00055 [Paenibacillus vini]|uniref:hypothetical protein n=1 Tax=Paenibacillus vini TaxID=1476024 RepID=UPI0025B6E4E0|nr:hypothetical protein [Paenibacillus vini]MDN4066266.1 hypothetical protein [Paenibacillus vini]
MTKNTIYGEILYVGFIAEKGRVFNQIRKHSYRKLLKKHVDLWQRVILRMMDSAYTEEDEQLIYDFIDFCQTHKEIGKFYCPPSKSLAEIKQRIHLGMSQSDNNKEDMIILSFMNELVLELIALLKPKIMINRDKVHLTIRALHNLPKFFLLGSETFIYQISNVGVNFQDTIVYSIGNMDESMKKKYVKIYNELIEP